MITNVATKITIPSSANTRAFTADAGLNSVILLTSDVVGGTQVNRSIRARVIAHRLGYVLDFVDARACQGDAAVLDAGEKDQEQDAVDDVQGMPHQSPPPPLLGA